MVKMVEADKIYPLSKTTRAGILAASAKDASEQRRMEVRHSGDKGGWVTYDSPLDDFSDDDSLNLTFACLLPEGERSLMFYIERLLVEKKGAAIGIEFGGPGSNLFGDFSRGFFRQTAGVTLADIRTQSSKARDGEHHHEVIPGNMFSQKTRRKVVKWLSEGKADVIFERMSGGLNLVPQEPRFLSEIAAEWYSMLAEGGVMFAQIPGIFAPVMEEWKNFVNQNYPDQIQIEYRPPQVISAFWKEFSRGTLRLNKLKGAPVNLPLLSPRTVRNLYRAFLQSRLEKSEDDTNFASLIKIATSLCSSQ